MKTTTSLHWRLLGVLFLVGACAAEDLSLVDEADEHDQDALEALGKADSLSSTSTYYTVRPDTRRCVAPYCGGYWVKRANREETKCADGQYAAECYVGRIDLSALGFSDAEASAANSSANLFRGKLGLEDFFGYGPFSTLIVSEVWRPGSANAPDGVFYRVSKSLHEAKLNSTRSTTVKGFAGDLAASIQQAVGAASVIAVGTNEYQGSKKVLDATQFYVRFSHSDAYDGDTWCASDADCVMTGYTSDVSDPTECYCVICANWTLNAAAAERNYENWEAVCADSPPKYCPAYPCYERMPSCVHNACVTSSL